jgi:hypothetical protein
MVVTLEPYPVTFVPGKRPARCAGVGDFTALSIVAGVYLILLFIVVILWVLVLGFVVKASLVSAGECDSVGIARDGIPAYYYVAVGIYLGRVSFHLSCGCRV